MNLLFVDDEPLVRRGLQSLVDWKAQGFSVQGEAGGRRGSAGSAALPPGRTSCCLTSECPG